MRRGDELPGTNESFGFALSKRATKVNTPTFAGVFTLVNYLKSKWNEICNELLEVYSYMRAVTVIDSIPA